MKLLGFLFCALLTLSTLPAHAEYDSSWYKAAFWSGEYPNGFAVVDANVSLLGRAEMLPENPTSVQCALPQKAVFHPWNNARPATFITMSKIVKMTVKEDFEFVDGETKIPLKKGDEIEYLVYGGEGYFLVRINGVEYGADQDLYTHVEPVDDSLYAQDEWIQVDCASGGKAWLQMKDLTTVDEAGEVKYLPGLDSWYLGFKDYGDVRDLE